MIFFMSSLTKKCIVREDSKNNLQYSMKMSTKKSSILHTSQNIFTTNLYSLKFINQKKLYTYILQYRL